MRRREASLEGPATPFPPRPPEAAAARRDKLLPPRRCPHRTWAAPLEKWRRPLGLLQLLPAVGCQAQGLPNATRARLLRSRAASIPQLRGGGGPVSASPSRSPPLQSTKGPRGRGRCSPTRVWVPGALFSQRARGSRGPTPARWRPRSQDWGFPPPHTPRHSGLAGDPAPLEWRS